MFVELTREDLPGCQVKLSMSFEAAEVDKAFGKVYKELNDRGQVRGFRPGKVPRTLLLRHYGADAIRDSAWYELLQDELEAALEGLDVIGDPEPEEPKDSGLEEGQPVTIGVTVTLASRVQLGSLEGVTIYRPTPEADEASVDAVLERLREAHVEEVDTDRSTVGEGDAVTVSMSVTLAGEEEAGEPVESTVVAGREGLVPPIGEKLLGRMLEQSFDVEFSYPEDSVDASLAGKAAKAHVVVKKIRERRVPELGDELAEKVDAERFATLEDLRAEIKRQADAERAEYSRDEMQSQAVKALLERSEVEVPDALVAHVAASEIQSLAEDLKRDGMAIEDLEQIAGMSPEEFEQAQMARSRQLLRVDALMNKVAAEQDVEVLDEDLDVEVALFAEEQKLDPAFVRQSMEVHLEIDRRLRGRAQRRKCFDVLFTAADLQDMPVEEYRNVRDDLLRLKDEAEAEDVTDEPAAPAEEGRVEAGRPAEAAGEEAEADQATDETSDASQES